MTHEKGSPLCTNHPEAVVMNLMTIHTDSSRPSPIALYECPDCGAERRLPLEWEAA